MLPDVIIQRHFILSIGFRVVCDCVCMCVLAESMTAA